MSRNSEEEVEDSVVDEIVDLIKEKGVVTPREMNTLLETLASEGGEDVR